MRLEKDCNQTGLGLIRTITMVWSAVHHNFENLQTEQRLVLTGLSNFKQAGLNLNKYSM